MDSLQRYWATVVEVWNTGVFGIDLGRILVAAGILLLCLFLRHVFVRVVSARLQAWAARSKSEIDETLVVALEQPLGLIPVTFGLYLAAEFLELDGDLEAFVDNILESLIIIVIFWGFYRLVDPLSFLLRNLERLFSPELVGWLLKAIKATFLFLGAVAVLETWGIEVAPILAGLGIFGIAVALGAQDLFKNLIAGLLIIAEQRFSAGEWIKVDGVVEGTVEKIGFRSTRINRFDQAPVHVPNAELSDGVVTNFSRMTHRRIRRPFRDLHLRAHRPLQRVLHRHHAVLLHDHDQLGRVAQDQGGPGLQDQRHRRGGRQRLRLPEPGALRRGLAGRRPGALRPAGG
jgi:MscS family membrane protein